MCEEIYMEPNKNIYLTKTYLSSIKTDDYILYKKNDILFKILQNNEKDSIELQKKVFTKLIENGNSEFLIEKKVDTFKKLSDNEHGITVGAFYNGQLIAQTSVDFTNLKNEKANNINYLPQNITNIDYLYEIKGTMVDPNYQNLGIAKIMSKLIENKINEKYSNKKVLLVSEIAVNNIPNLKATFKSGFKVLQKYKASDGVECYLTYKPLNQIVKNIIKFDDIKELITPNNSEECNKQNNQELII